MQDAHENDGLDRADAVLAEYLLRVDRGEQPDREAFLAEHSDVAAELQAYFDDADAVEEFVRSEDGEDSPNRSIRNWPTSLDVIRYFGDYELLDEIGRGGMGVVYQARQRSLNRTVAVKMILTGQYAPQTNSVGFSDDGQRILINGLEWDSQTGQRILPDSSLPWYRLVAMRSAAIVNPKSLSWQYLAAVYPERFSFDERRIAAVFSPDRRWLVFAIRPNRYAPPTPDVSDMGPWEDDEAEPGDPIDRAEGAVQAGTITIYDTTTGTRHAAFPGTPTAIGFSRDSSTIAWGDKRGKVHMVDVAEGKSRATLSGSDDAITCLAFGADHNCLATGSTNGDVRIWDVSPTECLHVLRDHSTPAPLFGRW